MAVTLTLAKQHLEYEASDRDTLIGAYLSAAVAWVENYTGCLLTRRTVTQNARSLSPYVPLAWGPSPDGLTIDYLDGDGAEQTITDALIATARAYAPETGWPSLYSNSEAVLTYTAGYSTTPGDLDAAVLLLVGEYFANREAGTASGATMGAVESLCRPYRSVLV